MPSPEDSWHWLSAGEVGFIGSDHKSKAFIFYIYFLNFMCSIGYHPEKHRRRRTLSCFSFWASCAFRRSTRFFMVLLGERMLASFWAASSIWRQLTSFSIWPMWLLCSSISAVRAFTWAARHSSSLQSTAQTHTCHYQ